VFISLTTESGRAKLTFNIPSRGLLGYRSEFNHATRGQGLLNSIFADYVPFMGSIDKSKKGAIVSSNDGVVTAYALKSLEARGTMFIQPQDKVYNGMVVGENTRDTDIEVNPTKAKQVTNMRTSGKEEFFRLSPPRIMTIEEAISYVRGM